MSAALNRGFVVAVSYATTELNNKKFSDIFNACRRNSANPAEPGILFYLAFGLVRVI